MRWESCLTLFCACEIDGSMLCRNTRKKIVVADGEEEEEEKRFEEEVEVNIVAGGVETALEAWRCWKFLFTSVSAIQLRVNAVSLLIYFISCTSTCFYW